MGLDDWWSNKLHYNPAHTRLVRIAPASVNEAEVACANLISVGVNSLETAIHACVEKLQRQAKFIGRFSDARVADVFRITGEVRELSDTSWALVFGLTQLDLLDAQRQP